MRFLALILTVCTFLTLCTGCAGKEVRQTVIEEQPEATFEPVYGYTAEYSEVDCGLSALTPVFSDGSGFYCKSYDKTGENIPEDVIRAAKKKNREPYNDGRYDVFATKLWKVSSDGTVGELTGYSPLTPESNAAGWKEFSCETGFEDLAVGKNGKILTLEYNAVSGNSAPDRRADVVPGRNYLEYEVIWYIRTLDETGAEISSRKITGGLEDALSRFQKHAATYDNVVSSEEKLPFSWADAGVDGQNVLSDVIRMEDGSFRFLSGDGKVEGMISVSYQEREQEKTVLRVVSDTESAALLKTVSEFNASQDDICLVIESYEDAAADSAADIFCLTSDTCVSMAKAGMLSDLYPFLDSDEQLNRGDYFPNILASLEVDGGLYCTCAGFSIKTVIGASSVVGEKSGWTYEDLKNAWGAFGMGTDAFANYTTSGDVLGECLAMDLDQFVDWENGTCSFNGEAFTKLLFFSGNFPRAFDYAGHVWSDSDNTDLRIRGRRQMLQETTLNNFKDVLISGFEFGEDITFIGYPTLNGTGSQMTVSTLDTGVNLGISASSQYQQEAWQFLRIFFTEEYQENYWYFPSNTNVFTRLLGKEMETEYVLDQKGNIVYDNTTKEPMIQSVDTIYMSNFATVYIYPISSAKAEKLVDLVGSTTKIIHNNEDICTIVKDSVAGYYTGALSLYEAADAAQAAVTEYLNMLGSAEAEAA